MNQLGNNNNIAETPARSDSFRNIGNMVAEQDTEGGLSASWVQHWTNEHKDLKHALAHHAATHLIDYGAVIQVGSGTTLNYFMEQVVELQKVNNTPLDLMILTTNLQVMGIGRDAKKDPQHKGIFDTMQIILTGGALQLSLHSLVGQYAAEAVRTDVVHPKLVFFGAAGLTFEGGRLGVSYQFEDELTTQVSYATRPTLHRILLCDQTKLGSKVAWKAAGITAESMLTQAQKCTIISTLPDESDVDHKKVLHEVEEFEKLLERLKQEKEFNEKDFSLRLVNSDGEVKLERSLAEIRGRSAGYSVAKASATRHIKPA